MSDPRNAFVEALQTYCRWRLDGSTLPCPKVDYNEEEIDIGQACRLVWHNTDTIPRIYWEMLTGAGVMPGRRTYAAASRALKREVDSRSVQVDYHPRLDELQREYPDVDLKGGMSDYMTSASILDVQDPEAAAILRREFPELAG